MHQKLGYDRRLERREPIRIPRWMLSAKYVGFVALGIFSSIAGVPSLTEATWRGYTIWWAAALTVVSIFAFLGSLRAEWETIEKWGASGIASILSAYTFAAVIITWHEYEAGDLYQGSGRVAFVVLLVIINMMPLSRALSLLRRTGATR